MKTSETVARIFAIDAKTYATRREMGAFATGAKTYAIVEKMCVTGAKTCAIVEKMCVIGARTALIVAGPDLPF